ncbi:MAG TPA: FAD-dependent monooxygenase [Gemmatimonadales bacterium]|nr:FAD-dependent monooxygenase [Gemmatimonadales bacterium]
MTPDYEPYEAVVMGAGPAGAAAARLLARWGHRVLLLARPESARPPLAVSLPPSTKKLLAKAELLNAVEAAGFYRSTGNTVWWESAEPRVESFAGGTGYQVLRERFDRLLIGLAEQAGAEVRRDASVRAVRLAAGRGAPARVDYDSTDGARHATARWVLDCTGRSGVLARSLGLRRAEPGLRTLALVAAWSKADGWDVPDETHTLVESYGDGWAWSVPLSRTLRHVAVMVDPRPGVTALAPEREADAMYRNEIGKTVVFRRLTAAASRQGAVAAHDASPYHATRACDPGFLLVGDACSFIDPLSSAGVKKALASAWLAAVTVHTALVTPAMEAAALVLFETRELEISTAYRRLAAQQFGRVTGRHDHAFWTDRAVVQAVDDSDPGHAATVAVPHAKVRDALEDLKQRPAIRLARTSRWKVTARPAVLQNQVVLEQRLPTPRDPAGTRFLYGVDVVRLGPLAEEHRQVPDLFEAYNRAHQAVGLPEFLAALATLIADGMLEHRPV